VKATKIELVRPSLIRPEPRPIIELAPEDVREFVATKEIDVLRVLNTPEVAKVCLELNREDNRSISKHKRALIARDMERGTNVLFKENGDTIKFDRNGCMFDGQKREQAIILSNTPQVMLWAVGLDPEAHFVTDKGQKRSLGDSLRIERYRQYTIHAATAHWLYLFKFSNDPVKGLDTRQVGSDEEVYELIKRHPLLAESCRYCHGALPGKARREPGVSYKQLLPVSLLAAIHYVATNFLDKEEEANFFVNTIMKFPLDTAYPHARERKPRQYNPVALWLDLVDKNQKAGIYVRRETKGTGTIQAWNLYSDGKWLEKFKLSKFAAIANLDLDLL